MATKEKTNGSLKLKNTPTSIYCIRQVEPNHTERILGVCMATASQMKTENDICFR